VTQDITYTKTAELFRLPPELLEVQELVRKVVDAECIPLETEFLAGARLPDSNDLVDAGGFEYDGRLTAANWARLTQVSAELGIDKVDVPVEYGGLGYGVLGRFVVEEQLNRSLVRLPKPDVPGILYGCTPYQEERYLWPTIRGEKKYAFAQTEPGAGSDPGNSMTTRAVRDGGAWLVTGSKTFITGASFADYFLLLVVTDPERRQHGGMTLFLVDSNSPGISMTPIDVWLTRQPRQFTVYFDQVRIPNENVVGDVGSGFSQGQVWLTIQDRLVRGSLACGILSRSLDMCTAWSKERYTFGAPLSERQAIQWMLVDVFADLKCIRAISYECAARADAGEDVRILASLAKLLGGNWGHRSVDKVMQILGGLGESMDSPVPHWYMQLRHGRIGGGTDEIQRIIIARALLAQGRQVWEN
jgi:acyl-CoA dehydrogenase